MQIGRWELAPVPAKQRVKPSQAQGGGREDTSGFPRGCPAIAAVTKEHVRSDLARWRKTIYGNPRTQREEEKSR